MSHDTAACLASTAVTLLMHVWPIVPQVVQYLTVDYGAEFCDFYGARCNRNMIETSRAKSVPEVPPSLKLSWVDYKLPIPQSVAGAQPPKSTH